MTIDIKRELSIVTICTALAYLSAYFYQFGLLVYFNAPSDFISVDVNTLLFSVVVVAFIIYAIFGPSLIYYDIFKDKDCTKKQMICNTLVFYITFTIFYSFAFYGLQKLNSNFKGFGGISELIKPFSHSLIWNALVVIVTFFHSRHFVNVLNHPWKSTQYFFALNLSPIVLVISFFGGFSYAKVGVADYYLGNDGYFMVTENSKGVLVAKCDINEGVTFKRLELSFSDLKVNNNENEKRDIVNCLNGWRRK